MALTEPVQRERLHTRDIRIDGYMRADGLIEVEAHMTDIKTYAFDNVDRGKVEPGVPLHGMRLRMTLDTSLRITACEADMEYTPYTICPGAAPNFGRLAGLSIKPGFLREANARVGGAEGCTHLRELLQQVATVAFQTLHSVRTRHTVIDAPPKTAGMLIDTCYAYSSKGPLVRDRWPEHYTGEARDQAAQAE